MTQKEANNKFLRLLAKMDGGKKTTGAARREVLKDANKILGGAVYQLIKLAMETPPTDAND